MLERNDDTRDVAAMMHAIGMAAKTASRALAIASAQAKETALLEMASAIDTAHEPILMANARDLERAAASGLTASFRDRLTLDDDRIDAMAGGLRAIAALPDPVGQVMASWTRPNGLAIDRVRTPLGVVGVIYESRPNVTADAGGLCLKAGNAVILRGGSDSIETSAAIHACLVSGLERAGLPAEAIQMVPVSDRAAVGEMLKGLDGAIDVIVPRGGKSLVSRVQTEARVPVFAHLEGLCHVYVDASADLEMARSIVVNAKMRRTSVCGAAETLLIDASAAESHLAPIVEAVTDAGCRVRASESVRSRLPALDAATEDDWSTEYNDAVLSVTLVDGVAGALAHIARYSSNHTDAVIAEDAGVVARFFNEVDSAIVLHNASTQFADGGEFGMGAEIGIATGKMHARGPVGVEQLTSFNYRVRGSGQIRP